MTNHYLSMLVMLIAVGSSATASYANDNSIRGGFLVNPVGQILTLE